MRPDTYDIIVDTAKELSKYSGWLCLALTLYGLLFLIIYLILVQGFNWSIPIMIFTILTIVLSLLTIMFMFMVRTAKKRFDISQWRDFWMAFGHSYIIENYSNKKAVKDWLEENIPRLYRVVSTGRGLTIVFRNKEDAMACKLRWS